jgi:hypothetical protein
MLRDFKKIVDIFEAMGLDNQAYFTLLNDKNQKICIQYQKENTGKNWKLWNSDEESDPKKKINSETIQNTLKHFSIKEDDFLDEVSNSLLIQAAFADEFIRQLTILFGKEAIQKSIYDTQTFMEELSQSVEKILNTNKSSEKSTKNERAKLRVIK